MSTAFRSCAAIWVRNGQPSMVTDGLALSPDAVDLLRDPVLRVPLAPWSTTPAMTSRTTTTIASAMSGPRRRRRRGMRCCDRAVGP